MHCTDGSKNDATSDLKIPSRISAFENALKNLPRYLELSRSNIESYVLITSGTKFDILGVIDIPKAQLGRLVKAPSNVLNIIRKLRVTEQSFRKSIKDISDHSIRYPLLRNSCA